VIINRVKKKPKDPGKSKTNVKLKNPPSTTINLSQQEILSKYKNNFSLELTKTSLNESSLSNYSTPSNPTRYNIIKSKICLSKKLHKLKLMTATNVSNTFPRSTNYLRSHYSLNEEEAKPLCTTNSNNLSVSTYQYFDRNLNFEQWMKHKYKEISLYLKEPIKTPQRNLMSTIIFSTHKLKLMNQNESCLYFLTTQNLKSNTIFYLSKSYSNYSLHKASDIAVKQRNALSRSTNYMKCYILSYYNLNDANPNVSNSNLLILDFDSNEARYAPRLQFFLFIYTKRFFIEGMH
jgi:hypothetical protein